MEAHGVYESVVFSTATLGVTRTERLIGAERTPVPLIGRAVGVGDIGSLAALFGFSMEVSVALALADLQGFLHVTAHHALTGFTGPAVPVFGAELGGHLTLFSQAPDHHHQTDHHHHHAPSRHGRPYHAASGRRGLAWPLQSEKFLPQIGAWLPFGGSSNPAFRK